MGNLTTQESLTVVIPCHNEERHIEAVLRGCQRNPSPGVTLQYLVVDDASTDSTPAILKRLSQELPMTQVRNPVSLGFGSSLKIGVSLVRTPWVVFIDADGQYDPSDIARLLEHRGDDYRIVTGWRLHRADPLVRTLISFGFQTMNRLAFGIRMKDVTTSLKLGPTPALQAVAKEVTFMNGSFWSEFMARWLSRGYAVKEVPIRHLPRRMDNSRVFEPGKVGRLVLHQFVGLLRLMKDLSHREEQRVRLPSTYPATRSR